MAADCRTVDNCVPAGSARAALSEGQAGTGLARYFERNVSSYTTYDLSGAVSVVTGGGLDVGKATARALAADWVARNLCVNAAGPGSTRTEFNSPTWVETEYAGEYPGAVPRDRVAEPEVKNGAVPFLSSTALQHIIDQPIYVECGCLAT